VTLALTIPAQRATGPYRPRHAAYGPSTMELAMATDSYRAQSTDIEWATAVAFLRSLRKAAAERVMAVATMRLRSVWGTPVELDEWTEPARELTAVPA
jgi:hypothetical protein